MMEWDFLADAAAVSVHAEKSTVTENRKWSAH